MGGAASNAAAGGVGGLAGQAQGLASQAAGKASDVCQQLPQLFGAADKVPPAILEQCRRVDGAKDMLGASGPGDICSSLDKVFGSPDKVPKEVQEKCNQLKLLQEASKIATGTSSLFGGAGSGAAGAAAK